MTWEGGGSKNLIFAVTSFLNGPIKWWDMIWYNPGKKLIWIWFDSGVGKTSILSKFVGEEVMKSHISTIGIDFKMKNLTLDGKAVKIQIWDTAGEQKRIKKKTFFDPPHLFAQNSWITVAKKRCCDNIRRWNNERSNQLVGAVLTRVCTYSFLLRAGTLRDDYDTVL